MVDFRRAGWISPILRRDGKPGSHRSTNTRPAGWATRSPCRWCRSIAACGGGCAAGRQGRGLGHTGGTLDKLESIAGFSAGLLTNSSECVNSFSDVGAASLRGRTSWRPPTAKTVRAARHHRYGRIAAADRQLGDEQEDRRGRPALLVLDVKVGSGRADALKSEARCARTCPRPWSRWAPSTGIADLRSADRHESPRWALAVGNAHRSRRGARGIGGRRSRRTWWSLTLASGSRDARHRRASTGADPEQTLRDGTAMDRFRATSIAAQGGRLVAYRCRLVSTPKTVTSNT